MNDNELLDNTSIWDELLGFVRGGVEIFTDIKVSEGQGKIANKIIDLLPFIVVGTFIIILVKK